MDNTEKARELINKHLYLHGGDGLGITDGNVYRAVLDAVSEALTIPDVGTRLFGVYSPEDDLLAVHATKEGAEENKANYENQHGEGFYVDYVMLQP